jgi:hypothetical protein
MSTLLNATRGRRPAPTYYAAPVARREPHDAFRGPGDAEPSQMQELHEAIRERERALAQVRKATAQVLQDPADAELRAAVATGMVRKLVSRPLRRGAEGAWLASPRPSPHGCPRGTPPLSDICPWATSLSGVTGRESPLPTCGKRMYRPNQGVPSRSVVRGLPALLQTDPLLAPPTARSYRRARLELPAATQLLLALLCALCNRQSRLCVGRPLRGM